MSRLLLRITVGIPVVGRQVLVLRYLPQLGTVETAARVHPQRGAADKLRAGGEQERHRARDLQCSAVRAAAAAPRSSGVKTVLTSKVFAARLA